MDMTIDTKLKLAATFVFVYALIVLTYVSCKETKKLDKPQNILVFNTKIMGNVYEVESEYKVVSIDSCEYIVGWVGDKHGGPYMVHKGNCSNKKHKL